MNWDLLGKRADTMRWALESIWPQAPIIVETGCIRGKDTWVGDGMSTVVFEEHIRARGGHLYSVDIDPEAVASARRLAPLAEVALGDSVEFLRGFDRPIDLLYLDSLDYPDGALRDLYGGKADIHAAIATLDAMGDDEIVARHWDLIGPSQEHCAAEITAALPWLHPLSVVLIDDALLPGGGKARLADGILLANGWERAQDAYQRGYRRP